MTGGQIRAAIYARKSNEQPGVDKEEKSVERQIEGGRDFIEQKGWNLVEVYGDDAVSGALWKTRKEFQRMMRDAALGVFDALIFFDIDRFGRTAHKMMTSLHALADLGITIWDYSTDKQLDLDSFEGEINTFVQVWGAQKYRDSNRKHTRSAMRENAKKGWIMGGTLFGYDNVRVDGYVERRIKEQEAVVVREIYERYARGEGYRVIAWSLNANGVPAPTPKQRGALVGWAPSTVRCALMQSLYRGEYIYGKTKKAYGRELGKSLTATREKGQIRQPEEVWIKTPMPELRIIEEPLAAAVDARRAERGTRYRRSHPGALPRGRYLLSGFLLCPCGGKLRPSRAATGLTSTGLSTCALRVVGKGPRSVPTS